MLSIVARLAIVLLATGGTATVGATWASAAAGGANVTGTVVLGSGYLTISPPPPLTWNAPLIGSTQYVVDTLSWDEGYVVNDATGTAQGWNVTVAVSPFSCIGGPCSGAQLPDEGTLTTNGSVSSASSTAQPSRTCSAGASCVLPENEIEYPVQVTTGGSPTRIFDSASDAGLGSVDIGGSAAPDPVGWWLTFGQQVQAGTYSSLMAVAVNAGP